MKATDELKQEHESIIALIGVMDKVCDRLEAGQEVDLEHLEQITEFIVVFADRCHHGKEEGLLLKAIEEAGVPKEGGPIGVMLTEHDVGRGYVRSMREAITAYKAGDKAAASKIAANARGYAKLLSQHIDKENNALYPMAEMHLSDDKDAELLAGFARIERDVLGEDKHEELNRNLKHLEEIYVRNEAA